jgi:hypothetical protein
MSAMASNMSAVTTMWGTRAIHRIIARMV